MNLNEFIELTTLTDDCLLLAWDNVTKTTKNVKLSTLKVFLGSGTEEPSTETALTHVSNGDTNGLFYFLGTNLGTDDWQNPVNLGLIVSASSVGSGLVSDLVNRENNQFYTNSENGSWVQFQIPTGFKCNKYSIKSRNQSSDYYPRNWKLQGSDDGTSWVDLDVQASNSTLNSLNQWLTLPVTSDTAYVYFRVAVTGFNSAGYYHLVLGEVELYGVYQ